MVFLIQNTQNRDSHALHLKIDELLRALDAADTRLCDLEERSEAELQKLREHYIGLANGPCDSTGRRNGEPAADTPNPGKRPAAEPIFTSQR
jgi:low affinity Fe/Cu permease